VTSGARQLRERVLKVLDEARLSHGEAKEYGTPRRLAVIVADVVDRQPDLDKEVMGRPSRRPSTRPASPRKPRWASRACRGWRSIDWRASPRPRRVPVGRVLEVGKPALVLLPSSCAASSPASTSEVDALGQPQRDLRAAAAVDPGAAWREGHRAGVRRRAERPQQPRPPVLHPDPFPLREPGEYVAELRKRNVEVDPVARKATIDRLLREVAASQSTEINPKSRRRSSMR